jgi:hypothetical protein
MSIIRFHYLVNLQSLFNNSQHIGEIAIVAALELNFATIAVNLSAIYALWIKGPRSQKSAASSAAWNGSSRNKIYTASSGKSNSDPSSHEIEHTAKHSPQISKLRTMASQFSYISLNRDPDEDRTNV